jgi:hypothetical protein
MVYRVCKVIIGCFLPLGYLAAESDLSPINDHIWNYSQDVGREYGARQDGYVYGWSEDNTANVFERDKNVAPDERYDRGIVLDGKSWEMALKNGVYRVLIVAGDANVSGIHYKIMAEDVLVVDGEGTEAFPWVSGIANVEVMDGKLTVSGAPGSSGNKLAYIHILSPIEEEYEEKTYAELPLKVNAGGGEVSDFSADKRWRENADYGYYLEDFTYNEDIRVLADSNVADPVLEPVYRTMRKAVDRTGNWFGYRVRVQPGTYYVTLLLAEYEKDRDRKRVAKIRINDTEVVSKIDYFTDIGLYQKRNIKKEVVVSGEYVEIEVENLDGFYSSGSTLSGFILSVDSATGVNSSLVVPKNGRMLTAVTANGIRLTNAEGGGNVTLYNLSGKAVRRVRYSGKSAFVKLTGIAPSMYLMVVDAGSRGIVRKQFLRVR